MFYLINSERQLRVIACSVSSTDRVRRGTGTVESHQQPDRYVNICSFILRVSMIRGANHKRTPPCWRVKCFVLPSSQYLLSHSNHYCIEPYVVGVRASTPEIALIE